MSNTTPPETVQRSTSNTEGSSPSRNRWRDLIDNPTAVLVAVFCAMAVLGIPLIWMCRVWSPTTKFLLTLATLIYTALLFWLFALIMLWAWSRIRDFH